MDRDGHHKHPLLTSTPILRFGFPGLLGHLVHVCYHMYLIVFQFFTRTFNFPLTFGARTVSHSFELPTTASDTQETMGIYCKMEEKAGRGKWAVGSGAPWGSPADLAVGSAVGEGGCHQPPAPAVLSQGF